MTNSCEECSYLKNCIKQWVWLINLGRMCGMKPEEALAKFTFHNEKQGRTPSIEWILQKIETEKDAAMKEYVM